MTRQEALVTPAVLQWARESGNLDLVTAAQKLSVSVERLHQWEAGERRPTLRQARRAAEVYKRPFSSFFLPVAPPTEPLPRDFRRLPNEEPAPVSPALRLELRRALFRRRVALELTPPDGIPAAGFVGSASLTDDPGQVAGRARTLLGVSLESQRAFRDRYVALNAWKDRLESLGILVFHFSGVAVEDARGFSLGDIPLPVIGVNGGDSPKGRIFTLVHEFAHLLVGVTGSCALQEEHLPAADRLTEVFCNAVAGNVLVPSGALLDEPLVAAHGPSPTWSDEDLHELANEYQVSREVILRRLLSLQRTTVEFYRAERELLNRPPELGGGGPIPIPRRVIRAVGQRFARSVIDAYDREAITSADVSEYLGTRLKHLSAIRNLLDGPNLLTGGDR